MPSFPDRESRYPKALIDERNEVRASGDFRARARFDLISRPHHACGLLAAADMARFCGIETITAIEFGVAEGAGLKNLIEVAAQVTAETGVAFKIIGFDSGQGLPAPLDARDHPEIWTTGDFAMGSAENLRMELGRDAELVLGPVATTLPEVMAAGFDAPVGFVSLDMDYYSSTVHCLKLFDMEATALLPVVVCYFDDVTGNRERIGSMFRTQKAGQYLAIDEFNDSRIDRSIDPFAILRQRRPFDREPWLDKMYTAHVLDHPVRVGGTDRDAARMARHSEMNPMEWSL